MSSINRAKRAFFDAAFQTGKVEVQLAPGRKINGAARLSFDFNGRFDLKSGGIENTIWGTIPWAWIEEIRSGDQKMVAVFLISATPEKLSKRLPPGWRLVAGGKAE